MKRRLFSVAIVMVMLVLSLSGCNRGQDVGTVPSTEEMNSEQEQVQEEGAEDLLKDFVYSQNDTGYTICGMKTESVEDIVIPDIVTRIEGFDLFANPNVKTITISDSVTYIDNFNVSSCTKLNKVIFPFRVDYMGTYNFSFSVIKEVRLPEGMTDILPGSFYGCAQLEIVNFPTTLTTIGGEAGNGAFDGCSKLKDIILPEGLQIIGANAFAKTAIQEIKLPEMVTEIGEGAFFKASSLSNVIWPKNIRTIGQNAFRETALTECKIPDGVKTIGDLAFRDCKKVTYIYIPGTVTSLGLMAFSGNDRLQEVYIGDGLSELPLDTFGTAENLTKITIPASVTKIGEHNYPGEEVIVYTPTGSYAQTYLSALEGPYYRDNGSGEMIPYYRYTFVNY